MAATVTFVTGNINPDRVPGVKERYEAAVAAGLPAGMERTYMLQVEPGRVAILSIWRDRDAVEAMIATGEEPLARRLIREAGGDPEPVLWEALASA